MKENEFKEGSQSEEDEQEGEEQQQQHQQHQQQQKERTCYSAANVKVLYLSDWVPTFTETQIYLINNGLQSILGEIDQRNISSLHWV